MRCKSPHGRRVRVAVAVGAAAAAALQLQPLLPNGNCRRFVLPTRCLVTDPAPINCNQYTRRPIPAAACYTLPTLRQPQPFALGQAMRAASRSALSMISLTNGRLKSYSKYQFNIAMIS